jgi:hypothetical protein
LIAVPNIVTVVSVIAGVTTSFKPAVCVGVVVTDPTVNPAPVIVELAVALAVPFSYCRLSSFSFRLWTFIVVNCHVMLPYLLGQPKYRLRA